VVSTSIVALVLGVLVLVVALAVALLFAHGVWLWADRLRNRGQVERGRSALYQLLQPAASPRTGAERSAALEVLRALPARIQESLSLRLAASLDPSETTPLAEVAREIGIVRRAERLCASRRWWRRLRGARLLTAVGGGSEPLLRLLRDPVPAVRAQAAEWAAEHPSPEAVRLLVDMLADPAALSRFAVQDALLRLGAPAGEPLARILDTAEGDALEAALRVASGLPHPRFVPAGIRLCGNPDPAVRERAAGLLGAIGGTAGADAVTRLLGDPDARVRTAAVRALARMKHWIRAPEIAARMRDTSWEVRRSAALALLALGSPGMLMLRRMLEDANSFAADMARQVLDLPSGASELRP
jgi:HEAT repeat protein